MLSPEELWKRVRVWFEDDDDAILSIRISNLGPGTEAEVVALLLATGTVPRAQVTDPDAPEDPERIPAFLLDTTRQVVEGDAHVFHMWIESVSFAGTPLPKLGLHVLPKGVEIDYYPGPWWGPNEVHALFEILLAIKREVPRAEMHLADPFRSKEFDRAIAEFVYPDAVSLQGVPSRRGRDESVDRRAIADELEGLILRNASVEVLARWAYMVYVDLPVEAVLEIGEPLMAVAVMTMGPEFELGRSDLLEIVEQLRG